ncbi:glycoside hydrolase family 1 protein [Clostridium sp.]|uniref:glycoside hydrolase family 1 protein n=1 Tax=Clostridium sp. TaxID=1506 RepID=UPI001A4D5B9D|nr:glycoside hydrolase family 1 protein [Clostridium sp.]MBK5235990.1 glycoside hydrolase family 1 protein [Clostridium sp.]
MELKNKFPKDFWWGSASSGPQSEGTTIDDEKALNIWDYWYEKEPYRFFNEVGPALTSDFYHKYKQDIKLMKEIGHNSFRFSISWSRLIPREDGIVNEKAKRFYNDVINELLSNGIEPFINLFHFDMPLIMQDKGGWESRDVVNEYVKYARVCFELFGDRVKKWFTFNEPVVPVEGGYLYDFHYPNVVDFKRAVQVAYNTTIASAKAIKEFKSLNIENAKIGIILNLTPSYPRSNNPADLKAANIADLLFNRSFLDPCVKGVYPEELIKLIKENNLLPDMLDGDADLIKQNVIQFLGVNYYQPRRIKAKASMPNPESPIMPDNFFDNYDMPGRKMNVSRGWEIYEKGVYDIMINLKDNYGNIESFISENGMGVQDEGKYIKDGIIDDSYRIDFLKGHLTWLHKSIDEGCNVKGYHMWTFIDNWSWSNAYKNRYGFIQLDLKTQKRILKKSAYWIKEVAKNNGF